MKNGLPPEGTTPPGDDVRLNLDMASFLQIQSIIADTLRSTPLDPRILCIPSGIPILLRHLHADPHRCRMHATPDEPVKIRRAISSSELSAQGLLQMQ